MNSLRLSTPETNRIRIYRAAALSITNAGDTVAFDTQSAFTSGLGYTHASGILTILAPGYHRFRAQVEISPTLLLTEVTLELQADLGSGYVLIGRSIWPATGAALVASTLFTASVSAGVDLEAGALVRLVAQTSGATSAAIVTGDGVSYLEAWLYST